MNRQLLIRLSQPGPGVEVPDTVEVVANALVTMVKKGAEGGDEWRNGVSLYDVRSWKSADENRDGTYLKLCGRRRRGIRGG